MWVNYLVGETRTPRAQVKQKYGITDERASLAAALAEWEAELATSPGLGYG